MGRSQRLYIYIIIGFIIWFIIFLCQILYFSSFSIHNFCWFSSCKNIFYPSHLSKKIRKTLSPYEKSLLTRIHHQPLIQQYESRHVNFLRLIKPITSSKKYFIYTCNQPCGGWGDRTRKIVGAYLLSLVLNRTFIINMTWPCTITNFLEPNFIQWNQTIKSIQNLKTNLTINNLGATDKDYGDILTWENIDIIYFKVKDLGFYSLLLWRDDFYRILHLQYGLHRSILFLHNIFTLIYELLFKLKSHPQTHFNDLVKTFKLKSLHCAHIRIGKNPSNPNDIVFPKRERMNKTVIEFLKNHSKLNDTIFVSTDSEQVQLYAKKIFHSRLMSIEGNIRHIDRSGKKLACDGFEKTILDFYMISQCHTMVMSKSAFRLV